MQVQQAADLSPVGPQMRPIDSAIRTMPESIADSIGPIVQRREAHRLPVFRMDKSLINTAPPPAADELIQGLRPSRFKPWDVGPSEGIPELRQEIASWRRNLYSERITNENVLVTSGATSAFFQAVLSLVQPKERVVVMPPCFPSYYGSISIRGAEVRNIPLQREDDFEPGVRRMRDTWTPNSKLVLCIAPNNPTGTSPTPERYKEIEGLARSNNANVVLDETFSQFDLRPEPKTLHGLDLNTSITIGSFSEAFSLADLRVGYLIGPADLVKKMTSLQNWVSVSASARAQEVAFAALREREQHLGRLVPILRQRDAQICDTLERLPGVEDVIGHGGPFKWIKTKLRDSRQLALDLAKQTGVVVRPGVEYGQEGWIRVAFGMIGGSQAFSEALKAISTFSGLGQETGSRRWDADASLPRASLSTDERRALARANRHA